MYFVEISLIVCLLATCWSAPLQNVDETDPELIGNYIEGDMIFEDNTDSRTGLRAETKRWPNNIVYYRFGEKTDEVHLNHIRRGYDMLESVSCLKFIEDKDKKQEYYVNITFSDGGCFSYVGFLNSVQQLNYEIYPVDEGCFRLGTIMHEMLHALGFYHTQSASNRDDYVRIAFENVRAGTENNFKKYEETVVDDFDLPYDYGSVMHYSSYAFSANGERTIIPLDPEGAKVMGQRKALSSLDIFRLNSMYKCPIYSK